MDSPTAHADAPVAGDHGPAAPMTGTVTVRYFAGARAAAGVAEEPVAAAGSTLAELSGSLVTRHGRRLGPVLEVASFLVDGVTCHDRSMVLPVGATVDVLPPFAGG